MTKALSVRNDIRKYDLAAPNQMSSMAKVLQSHITKNGLSTNIVGKNYTQVEGWQFAGGLLGYMPKVIKVEDLSTKDEKKWRADVEIIRIKDNAVMSTGVAICSNSEGKKKGFDEYAVVSMAQTRAIGKAYRNLIGWVMKMAGYESTPTEEMMRADNTPAQNIQRQTSEPKKESKETLTAQVFNTDIILDKLKAKLFKLGADSEAKALKLLEKKTGLVWKSLSGHGPVAIKEAYSKLLNSK